MQKLTRLVPASKSVSTSESGACSKQSSPMRTLSPRAPPLQPPKLPMLLLLQDYIFDSPNSRPAHHESQTSVPHTVQEVQHWAVTGTHAETHQASAGFQVCFLIRIWHSCCFEPCMWATPEHTCTTPAQQQQQQQQPWWHQRAVCCKLGQKWQCQQHLRVSHENCQDMCNVSASSTCGVQGWSMHVLHARKQQALWKDSITPIAGGQHTCAHGS